MTSAIYNFFLALPAKMREEDKLRHVAWSFCLTLAARFFWPVPAAFAAVFLLGLAKEGWDSRFGSGFCWFDMTGNLVGIVAALLLAGAFPGTFSA